MRDRFNGPPEDMLTVRIYGADQKQIWHNKAKAVPRVGEDVLLFDEDKNITYAAPVTDVVWGMYDHVAGQLVVVQLGENKNP